MAQQIRAYTPSAEDSGSDSTPSRAAHNCYWKGG